MHAHRLEWIVERVSAEMAQHVPVLAFGGDEFCGRRRDEHLTAMAQREKSCHAIERRAEIVPFAPLGRSHVHGHPNAEAFDRGPVVPCKCLLGVDRSA